MRGAIPACDQSYVEHPSIGQRVLARGRRDEPLVRQLGERDLPVAAESMAGREDDPVRVVGQVELVEAVEG